MSGPVVTAIKRYALRLDIDPTVVDYERVVYKTALAGANPRRERLFANLCADAASDALVMLEAVSARQKVIPE